MPTTPAELVTRANDLIAGRIVPPFGVPGRVKEVVARVLRSVGPEPTPEEEESHWELATLPYYYAFDIVGLYPDGKGGVAILGAGEEQIRALFAGLSREEIGHLKLEWPEPL